MKTSVKAAKSRPFRVDIEPRAAAARNAGFRYSLDLAGIRVHFGFTTRALPLAVSAGADFERALATASDPGVLDLFSGKAAGYGTQVHSDRVAEVPSSKNDALRRYEETDGFLTLEPGVRLFVFSADCLPLFLFASGPKPAAGVVHAGWRGTRLGIGRKAAALLKRKTGARPERVGAILGPCLRRCCYEVGEEFKAYFPKTVSRSAGSDRLYFDLAAENIRQLAESGVPRSNIRDLEFCTACRPELFYSYRREGEKAGRLISWIWWERL